MTGVLDFWAFQLSRLWRRQPGPLSVLLAAALCAVAAAAAYGYWSSRGEDARAQLSAVLRHAPAPRVTELPLRPAGTDLPAFDSARFTAAFHALARDVGVPTDEIFYVLDSSAEQPYLRYRITLEAKSGYPELRKLLAALAVEQPNVVLDAIRCRREDARVVPLTCQLALSAFFSKGVRG